MRSVLFLTTRPSSFSGTLLGFQARLQGAVPTAAVTLFVIPVSAMLAACARGSPHLREWALGDVSTETTGRDTRDLGEGRRRGCLPPPGRGVRPVGTGPAPGPPHPSEASSGQRRVEGQVGPAQPGSSCCVWAPGGLADSPHGGTREGSLCAPMPHTPLLSPSSQPQALLSNFWPTKTYQPLSRPISQPQIPA